MNLEKLKKDLDIYQSDIKEISRKVAILEEQKTMMLRAGTRLEGVIFYIKKSIEDLSKEIPLKE